MRTAGAGALSAALAGLSACKAAALAPAAVFAQTAAAALAEEPRSVEALAAALGVAPAAVIKQMDVYQLLLPAAGVESLEVRTVLAQGKERVTRVAVMTTGDMHELVVPRALREKGWTPVRPAMPVRPHAPESLRFAKAVAGVAEALDLRPTNLLALCQALGAKCAIAEPAPAEAGNEDGSRTPPAPSEPWRCAGIETWHGSQGTLFAKARACLSRRAGGQILAAVDLVLAPSAGVRPAVALGGFSLLRHRAITATLVSEDLLARTGAAYLASVRYGLDPATPGAGPLAVRRVVAANALLCGSGGRTEGCVQGPAAVMTVAAR